MPDPWISFGILAAAGCLQACFPLPLRHFRGWQWEQVWVAQAIACGIVLPWVWALLLPAPFWSVAAGIPVSRYVYLLSWGVLLGAGGVAYGLTLTRLGASFAYSFVFGITVLTGAILPVWLGSAERPGHVLLFAQGMALLLVSISGIGLVCERPKESEPALPIRIPFPQPRYTLALVLAVAAGALSASYGLAFSIEFGLVARMLGQGIPPVSAQLIIALPVYLGAGVFIIVFGLICAGRAGTLARWRCCALRNWGLALLMGASSIGGVVLYGIGSSSKGHPAPNIAFGIFMSFLVLSGVGIGLASGELRGLPAQGKAILALSVAGLISGAWLLRLS